MGYLRRIGIFALLICVTAFPGAPAQAGSGHPPDRIDLPNGWRPEGITTDGKHLYVGSLADGSIWRASPRTGEGEVLATGEAGRTAVGVEYDRRRDVLWVAGGATGVIRAQDADTGRVLRTYTLPPATARFVNDLVVTRRAVFATDSEQQELAVVPLKKRHHHRHHHGGTHLPPASAIRMLPLTGDFELQDGFDLNGIARSGRHLLAVQSNTGLLFRINGRTGDTLAIDLGGASLVNGDGIEVGRDAVYVVQNRLNQIAVLDLNRRLTRGTVEQTITDPGFDVPTTVALVRHSLFAVNARFTTTPTPDTAYWITRVDAP